MWILWAVVGVFIGFSRKMDRVRMYDRIVAALLWPAMMVYWMVDRCLDWYLSEYLKNE